MVHDYGPGHTFVSAHVQMDGHADAFKNHEVLDSIERDFKKRTGASMTLHYDPVDTTAGDDLAWLNRQLAKVDSLLSAHDLRIEKDFLTFDLVKPDECSLTDEEALGRAMATAAERWPGRPASVTVDHGFLARG